MNAIFRLSNFLVLPFWALMMVLVNPDSSGRDDHHARRHTDFDYCDCHLGRDSSST